MSSLIDPAAWVDGAASNHPERVFLRTPAGRSMSYSALRERSDRFARALLKCGAEPGDRIAVQVDKSVEAVILYVACLRLGVVFVPINVANTAHEVDYFVDDSRPRVAVVRPADREQWDTPARRTLVARVETLGADGSGSFMDLVPVDHPGQLPVQRLDANAIAAIVYTSGTTGRSKGAMLTRGNLASNAAALAAAWRFSGDDVLLHTLPLFHVHGLFAAINTTLASASSLRLLTKFDAADTLRQMPHATVYMGVPTHYTRFLQESRLDREWVSRMRLFVSGSAPLLAQTHREFHERTGHRILERYGMTETLMNTSNPYDGERIPGSVGPPLPGVEVRVASGGADAVGALEIRGPNVFAGYWRDADKTRAAFTPDGWFKSGDLGYFERGYVYIVGRAKDVVISGGYNVYPKEVEVELDAVPGVLESAVFGVPHGDLGEGVCAAVVRAAGTDVSEATILSALQQRLARYKIPRRIVFVDELPRNTMGKVQKNALRAAHASLYRDA